MGGPPNLDLTRLLDPKISTKGPPEFKIQRDCRIGDTQIFAKETRNESFFSHFSYEFGLFCAQ